MPKKAINVETRTVTFTFEDQTSQTFELDKASAVATQLALHGASQKIGDSYAGAGDAEDPLAYAKAAVSDLISRLYAGEWTQSGGGGSRSVPVIILAFAAVAGRPVEEAEELFEAMSEDERKAWAKKPKVAAQVALIRAQRAAAKAERLAKAADEAEATPAN